MCDMCVLLHSFSQASLFLSLFNEVFSDRVHAVERRDNKAEQGKTRKDKIRQTRQDKRNERADVPQYKSSLCTGQYSRVEMDNDDVHDHSCRYGNSEGVLYCTHTYILLCRLDAFGGLALPEWGSLLGIYHWQHQHLSSLVGATGPILKI